MVKNKVREFFQKNEIESFTWALIFDVFKTKKASVNMNKFKVGDKVYYIPFNGCDKGECQNGIVKAISDEEHVFVVYHCDGNWDHYVDYTAARTPICYLRPGWV